MLKTFLNGIWKENPTFVIALGICPTLAVTTSAKNAFGMGLAATFVLLGSNLFISLIRKIVPDKIHIPVYILVIATFVTVIDKLIQAYSPALSESLGIYIPLIVVNCIILGRAEAFACKNPPMKSVADALGMGIGFTFALICISSIRELLGAGTILGHEVSFIKNPALVMILPPGGFFVFGFIIAAKKYFDSKHQGENQ
ncbi:MAG: electron transport complex subunit E [Candidatus Riflebacteria bacterium]|nr:electron transport complex subunit E [Candidatus Riflebacteria bacterium]